MKRFPSIPIVVLAIGLVVALQLVILLAQSGGSGERIPGLSTERVLADGGGPPACAGTPDATGSDPGPFTYTASSG